MEDDTIMWPEEIDLPSDESEEVANLLVIEFAAILGAVLTSLAVSTSLGAATSLGAMEP